MEEATQRIIVRAVGAPGPGGSRSRARMTFGKQPIEVEVTDAELAEIDGDEFLVWSPAGAVKAGQNRVALIVEAIGKLTKGNTEHYTQDGRPKVEAIEKILGIGVTAAERDEAVAFMEAL